MKPESILGTVITDEKRHGIRRGFDTEQSENVPKIDLPIFVYIHQPFFIWGGDQVRVSFAIAAQSGSLADRRYFERGRRLRLSRTG